MLKKVGFWDERGQAMVELALVVPLIILLILAIIDFGRVYSAQLVLNHAVRSGAREVAVLDTTNTSYDDYTTEVKPYIVNNIINPDAQFITVLLSAVTIQKDGAGADGSGFAWSTGDNVKVSAYYDVTLTAPIVKQIFQNRDEVPNDGKYRIKSAVTMRRE